LILAQSTDTENAFNPNNKKSDLYDIKNKNVEELKNNNNNNNRNECTYLLSFDLFSFRYNNLWMLLVRLKRTPHKQLSPNLK
jgi:copper oxidase (laccase) domain-containing protein